VVWLPFAAVSRTAAAAVHATPWLPAAPFLAAAEGSGTSGDVITAAVQQVLGYGILGLVALSLAWIVYKGSFVPQKRADEMVAAGRADLLRENEQLRAELGKTQEQRDTAIRFIQDQFLPLLGNFTAATSSLLPILQGLTRWREDDGPPSRRRGRELP
jgi:hypothetical protein